MSHNIKVLAVALPALVVWATSCNDRPPTASDETAEPSAQVQAGPIRNGVSLNVELQVARPGFINFDPPCLFARTLPLQDAPYMNPATRALFVSGEGAVLDECSGFSVSGFSKPNFLAWNCEARNFDGTKPALPAEIKFLDTVAEVSVKVGSSSTGTARLVAFNAAFERVDGASTTLTPNLKTLTVSASRTIKYVRLFGPCVMVADDFRITR